MFFRKPSSKVTPLSPLVQISLFCLVFSLFMSLGPTAVTVLLLSPNALNEVHRPAVYDEGTPEGRAQVRRDAQREKEAVSFKWAVAIIGLALYLVQIVCAFVLLRSPDRSEALFARVLLAISCILLLVAFLNRSGTLYNRRYGQAHAPNASRTVSLTPYLSKSPEQNMTIPSTPVESINSIVLLTLSTG